MKGTQETEVRCVNVHNTKEEERTSSHRETSTLCPKNNVEKGKCANEPYSSLNPEYSITLF